MSTIAIIAILVALILGGVIAALGDQIGTKVGKARLRLFNLRPKQTATLVTVVTGTLISASTFGILLIFSEPLRQGLFQLDEIKRDLRVAQDQVRDAKRAKIEIERELSSARKERVTVKQQLQVINQNFQRARNQLQSVSGQANRLRSDIQTLMKDREGLIQQKQNLDNQINSLKTEIEAKNTQLQQRDQTLKQKDQELQLQERKVTEQNQILQQRQQKLIASEKQLQILQNRQSKLQTEIDKRDQAIADLDEAIAQKDQILQNRELKLTELTSQLSFLQKQVAVLEEYYQTYQELRERQIAIVRGQVLAFGAVRIVDSDAVINVIDELLRQANLNTIRFISGKTGELQPTDRVVKITKAQVEQLIQQLQEKQDYVVRILSAGNYVQGEKEVRVFADVVPNQQIFSKAEIIAQVSIDPDNRHEEEMQKRLDLLLSAARFRARRAGILGPIQIEEGQIKALLTFIEKVSESEVPIDEIQAIAAEDAYTAGPLQLRLLAIDRGDVIIDSEG